MTWEGPVFRCAVLFHRPDRGCAGSRLFDQDLRYQLFVAAIRAQLQRIARPTVYVDQFLYVYLYAPHCVVGVAALSRGIECRGIDSIKVYVFSSDSFGANACTEWARE